VGFDPTSRGERDTADLEARWQLVVARYGDRLDDAQRADLRSTLEALVKLSRRLRAVPLTNADPPLDLAVPWRTTRRPSD
jgi:hypothetical protein